VPKHRKLQIGHSATCLPELFKLREKRRLLVDFVGQIRDTAGELGMRLENPVLSTGVKRRGFSGFSLMLYQARFYSLRKNALLGEFPAPSG
jgi:hypothetical protein